MPLPVVILFGFIHLIQKMIVTDMGRIKKKKEKSMNFNNLLKSKTVLFNAVVAAVVEGAKALGYAIPSDLVVSVLTLGNFILRLVTDKPITEK